MSVAFAVMTMLLGSSVANVLHPSNEQPAASAHSPVSQLRCQGESWQSIRKGLLKALNLQTEPRLPAGGLDSVREQWQRTFSTISQRVTYTASSAVSGHSVSPDNGSSTSLKCCSVASEIFMKDLGWDNWVIQPLSLTIIQCALCNSAGDIVHCPSHDSSVQDANSQRHLPCCQPASYEMVPILYMDESSSITISSVQLPHSCSCDASHVQQPSKE